MIDLQRMGAGLPVAAHADEIRAGLAGRRLVVQAPPGTGKTTFVPPLVASTVPGRVVVTQPRRIAARAAARRLAALTGTRPGEFAGHTVRGESTAGRGTRVEFVTTGVLVQRLLRDPELAGVDAVILDEVHERHLDADLALAMVCELAQLRDDLDVVAMSATLDAGLWAGLLGDGSTDDGSTDDGDPAPVVEIPSVLHPLEIRWAPAPGSATDARGVRREFIAHVVARTGDAFREIGRSDGAAAPGALVFMPGAREVDAVVAGLRSDPGLAGVDVIALYGRMDAKAQDAALRPSGTPRIVVATSVAESSLTVPGVRLVVDSGLAREPRLDRGRQMTGLVTVRESKASATQRSGRAARLGPGVAVRCLPHEAWAGMDEEAAPQAEHADLVGPLLTLACWGSPRGEGMVLPSALPPDRVAHAEEELRGLGAVDADGRATARGRELAQIPADPRLARALLEAAGLIGARPAAEVVAMLASDERAADGDLVGLLKALRSGRHPGSQAWRRQARRLEGIAGHRGGGAGRTPADAQVGAVVALAHPGWVARRRGRAGYLLASGTGADLPRGSVLAGQEWLAVAETARTGGRGSGAVIRAAVPIDEATALDAAAGLEHTDDEATWRPGGVTGRRVHRLGAITLTSTPVAPSRSAARRAAVAALGEQGLGLDGHGVFTWSRGALELRRRLGLLRRVFGDPWPAMDEESLVARAEEWLGPELDALARGRSAGRASMATALRRLLPWPAAHRLDELAPETVEVPTGSRIRLDYPEVGSDLAPVLAVKLQECFGWTDGPRVCDGRVKVVLHLLSPARRPLAVTDDLASFWANAYPQVRAENRGRYIKHPWPEDPLTATPRRGTTRSGR